MASLVSFPLPMPLQLSELAALARLLMHVGAEAGSEVPEGEVVDALEQLDEVAVRLANDAEGAAVGAWCAEALGYVPEATRDCAKPRLAADVKAVRQRLAAVVRAIKRRLVAAEREAKVADARLSQLLNQCGG